MKLFLNLIFFFCTFSALANKPNILIFLVDDMGWQETTVPFYYKANENGVLEPVVTELNKRFHTPNMERLAAEGTIFTNAYATAVCSPSRVSLMTGQEPARHMVTNWTLNKGKSPDRGRKDIKSADWNLNGLVAEPAIEKSVAVPTLPSLLKKAGYYTIHAGKGHFGANDTSGANPLNLGFDINIAGHAAGGPGSYYGDKEFSGRWRGGSAKWDVPGLGKYHGQKINLTEALTREVILNLDKNKKSNKPFFLHFSHYTVHAPWEADRRFVNKYKGKGLSDRHANHASMIESMDKSLGDIMDWLEKNDEVNNTLFIFLSDNGAPSQMTRNKPLRGHKISAYEGGTRVPWIIRFPSFKQVKGDVNHTPIVIQDIFPTALAVAGVKNYSASEIDGKSFLATLKGNKAPIRAFVWHFPNTYDVEPYSSVRLGKWKMICHHARRKAELFDLDNDISEQQDLAQKYPEIAQKLKKVLSDRLRKLNSKMSRDKKTNKEIPLPDQW